MTSGGISIFIYENEEPCLQNLLPTYEGLLLFHWSAPAYRIKDVPYSPVFGQCADFQGVMCETVGDGHTQQWGSHSLEYAISCVAFPFLVFELVM